MDLTPCLACGGRGMIKKPVFPNSHKEVPCPRCAARLARVVAKADEILKELAEKKLLNDRRVGPLRVGPVFFSDARYPKKDKL